MTSAKPAHQPTAVMPIMTEERIKLFWDSVKKSNEDCCWRWLGAVDKNGYGKVRIGPRDIRAHRLAYFLETGIDPIGFLVLHSCDVPSCCNPKHISRGSNDENMADMVGKGRAAKGERHGRKLHPERFVSCPGEKNGMSKLTVAQVLDIRARYIPRKGVSKLAKEFGVKTVHISRIARRERWSSV